MASAKIPSAFAKHLDFGFNILVDLLRKAPAPVPPETLAATFNGRNTPKRRDRVQSLLETLTTIGLAQTDQADAQTRYFIPR